jgi:hypothetical protein
MMDAGAAAAASDRCGRAMVSSAAGTKPAMIDGRNNVDKTLKTWRCSMDNG